MTQDDRPTPAEEAAELDRERFEEAVADLELDAELEREFGPGFGSGGFGQAHEEVSDRDYERMLSMEPHDMAMYPEEQEEARAAWLAGSDAGAPLRPKRAEGPKPAPAAATGGLAARLSRTIEQATRPSADQVAPEKTPRGQRRAAGIER